MLIAAFQRKYPGAVGLYADSEQGMSDKRLTDMGVDMSRTFLISTGFTLETFIKVLSTFMEALAKRKNNDPSIVIWDSESATLPEKLLEVSDPRQAPAVKAGLMAILLPKLMRYATKYNFTMVFISQLRQEIKMNAYQSSTSIKGLDGNITTGGKGGDYYPFQIMYVKPKEDIKVADFGFKGIVTEVVYVKNKLSTPNVKVEIILDYKTGYSNFWSKERLIRKMKGFSGGGSASYLSNDPLKKETTRKFTKSTIEGLYNKDEEFKRLFDELFNEYLKTISDSPTMFDENMVEVGTEEPEKEKFDLFASLNEVEKNTNDTVVVDNISVEPVVLETTIEEVQKEEQVTI